MSITDHFNIAENELKLKLLGRVDVEHAAALHYFIKKGKVQKLIHAFKYKNKPQVATLMGKTFAIEYLESPHFDTADVIIPIPTHFARLQQRGYNQSYLIAKGVSSITSIPINQKVLIKNKRIVSQTSKKRDERFINVLNSFSVKNSSSLEGKLVLIVDDVFTTGATIEAAITKLQAIKDIKIQVGFIAMAFD
ncbi:phosphoribosyltransferase family protein [Saprospiraceae bacterium]|nr:phosphoribosyltransferase family protein [Saprospiraceae bacterium]